MTSTIARPVLLSALIALALIAIDTARAGVLEKTIEYKQGDTVLEGFLARPDTKDLKKKPAVIVVHEWDGLGDYAKKRTRQLAELGYVAFAADIYGKGVRAKNMEESSKLATKYKEDRPLMRKRIEAAIDTVQKMIEVNPKKVAVMGYCFGGTVALEAARDHAPILGVVSFHGGLSTPKPEETKKIKAKILALHGGEDPFVKADEVSAFQDEMRKSGADWQFISYGGAVHGFTNAAYPPKPGAGMAYNENADRRSWETMKNFFNEIFANH